MEEAIALSGEWCRIHQHFYVIWSRHNDLAYRYTEGELDSYIEPPDWAATLGEMAVGSNSRRRSLHLRLIRPVNPL